MIAEIIAGIIAEIIVGMIAEMDALGEKQMGDKKVQNEK